MIVFDPVQFKLDYPQFSTMSDNKLDNDFKYGASLLGQVVSSIWVEDEPKYYWLCLVLAHILECEANGLTGRVSGVSQRSESVNFDSKAPEWADYWTQTAYGYRIYQLIAEYVSGGHYVSDGNPPYNSDSMVGIGAYYYGY